MRGGPDLNEPLVTDRPDFTESSSTVGMGVVQLETGYTFTYDDNEIGKTNEHSFPEALLRIGMLADWFELRIGWNWGSSAENNVRRLVDQSQRRRRPLSWRQARPHAASRRACPRRRSMLQMNVPTGSSDFTAERSAAGLQFRLWLGRQRNIDIGRLDASQPRHRRQRRRLLRRVRPVDGRSATIGPTSLAATPSGTCSSPTGAVTSHNQQYFNGGFTYLITDNVQWDIRAGVGLNEAADDFFTGTGLSVRMF